MQPAQDIIRNELLAGLSASDFALLAPLLSWVELPARRQLEIRHRRIDHVYFIESGIVSMVISAGAQHSIEIGLVGSEGMTGIPVLLQADRPLHETFVQSAGGGWRIGADDFQCVMAQSATLAATFLRYANTLFCQMAFTALTNGRYKIEERLARWLLMASDRMPDKTIRLTHEFLAVMLGARRAGVTLALNEFEKRGMIQATRGVITIADRGALEDAANGSYGGPEAEYQRLFGEPSRD